MVIRRNPFLADQRVFYSHYYFVANLGGHYFSAYYQTAKFFALQKLGELKTARYAIQRKNLPMRAEVGLLYSIFICRVRNVCMAGYKYVLNDEVRECFVILLKQNDHEHCDGRKCADI